MGRIRTKNTHLPQRLFEDHGAYFYAHRENGKLFWLSLGRDEAAAIRQAETLNKLKRKERLQAIGAYRKAADGVRQAVMGRDGWRCVYCGSDKDLGIDHVIPYAVGGSSQPFNLVTACTSCNATKGDSDPREHILAMLGMRQQLMELALNIFSKS